MKHGFLLLSFTLYLFCTALIFCAIVPTIFYLSALLVRGTKNGVLLQNYIATQRLLTRDLQHGVRTVISSEVVHIESNDNIHIEWANDNDTQAIYRREGIYDPQNGWTRSKTALIMRNCTVMIEKGNTQNVHSFFCVLKTDQNVISWTVYPISGTYIRTT